MKRFVEASSMIWLFLLQPSCYHFVHQKFVASDIIDVRRNSRGPKVERWGTPDVDIQGVSEFHRQTFRTDSMIKNKHKTINTYGVKNA
jgi:hypothetical protein